MTTSTASQFPMFLKALYVDQWKITERRERLKTWEDFTALVEEKQMGKGEIAFDWEEPTDLLIKRTFIALGKYISAGELKDVAAELPGDIRRFLEEEVIGS